MRTSGIYTDSYDAVRYCGMGNDIVGDCYFEGDVEVFFDSESYIYVEWWTCPLCGYEHEEEDD